MKSIIAAGLLVGATSGAAVAGPYANIENNAGWVGNDFGSAVTEAHVGYEFEAGEDAIIYIQGGPAFVSIDGEDLETEYSGKVGTEISVSNNVDIYGEVGFITEEQTFDLDELALSTKIGVIYRF